MEDWQNCGEVELWSKLMKELWEEDRVVGDAKIESIPKKNDFRVDVIPGKTLASILEVFGKIFATEYFTRVPMWIDVDNMIFAAQQTVKHKN